MTKQQGKKCAWSPRVSRAMLASIVLGCCVLSACSAAIEEHGGSFMKRLLMTADGLRSKQDNDNALILYKKVIEHASSEDDELYGIDALNGYGETLLTLERAQEASEVFEHALARQPYDNGRALFGLAKAYLSLGRVEEAIERYLLIVQTWPESPEGYNGLGVAYDSKGFHDEAQKTYRKGLSYAPGDVSLTNNLGVSLTLSGRFAEAIRALQALSFDQKATPKIRQNLAFAHAFLGNMEAAEQISRIDLDPQASQRNLDFFRQLRTEQITKNTVPAKIHAKTIPSPSSYDAPKANSRNTSNNIFKDAPAPSESSMPQNMSMPAPPKQQAHTPEAKIPPPLRNQKLSPEPSSAPQQDIFAEPAIIEALDNLAQQDKKKVAQSKDPAQIDVMATIRSRAKQLEHQVSKNGQKGLYTVQVASYRSRDKANMTAERLRREGYTPKISQKKSKAGRTFHVLRIGSYQKTSDAIKDVEKVYRLLGVLGEIRISNT